MTSISTEFNQSLFHVSDPNEIYLTKANEKKLKTITDDIKQGKKLFLITGERGCGKTTLVKRAVNNLRSDAHLININPDIFSSNELIDYEELVNFIGLDLDADFSSNTPTEKLSLFKGLVKSKSIKYFIIVIDHPIGLYQKMMEKALHKLNADLENLCSFHLVIQALPEYSKEILESDELVSTLDDARLIQIDPLSKDEVNSYIKFHLRHIEEQEQIKFSEDALKRIVFYSKGLPALINRLCSLGILTANIEEQSIVSLKMIDEVLENSLFLGNEFNYSVSANMPEEEPDDLPLEKQTVLVEATDNSFNKETAFTDSLEYTKKLQGEYEKEILDSDNMSPVNSKKTSLLPAFILGMSFSAILGAGWYFLDQANQKEASQIPPSATLKAKQQNSLSQQLIEARLNRLEQQLKSQQQIKSIENTSDESEQNTPDLLPTSKQITTSSLAEEQRKTNENRQETEQLLPKKLNMLDLLDDSVVTDEKKKHIKDLIITAEQRLANKKLLYPVNESALSAYEEVLSIVPGHQPAIEGINKIKETYLSWARYAIKKGNKERALLLFNKALKVSPDDPDILSILKKIQNVETTGVKEVLLKSDFSRLLDDEKGVNELLGIAEQQIAAKNLTTPERSSAFAIYRAILDRFPMHKEAWAGINTIKNKYINWADYEMKKGDVKHAKYLYGKALELAPSDPDLIRNLEQFK